MRRGHKEGRCNSLTQRGRLQKEPARYTKMQAGTGLGPVPSRNFFVFKKAKAISTGPVKAEAQMAYFAVFFTIFKLLFLFRIKELGQSVAGEVVAKCLNKKSTDSKSLNSHLFPI